MATRTKRAAETQADTPTATNPEKSGTVVSVMRGINVTDAPLSSILGDRLEPVPVIRHGIRGTQNVSKKKAGDNSEIANPQITETAKTAPQANGLHVAFSLQVVPLRKLLTACDQPATRSRIERFLSAAEDSEELHEVCRRYAHRLFTGSFLWRNLHLAHTLDIEVTCAGETERVSGQQAFELAARGFAAYSTAERNVARWLQRAFVADGHTGASLGVQARVQFERPGAYEVYPSQVYVSTKPTGFARPLYKLNPVSATELSRQRQDADPQLFMDSLVMGQAALRDQKIGNALRTIDTWYAQDGALAPIAIEPNGASLSNNTFYRKPQSGNSFFDLHPRLDELTGQIRPTGSGQPSPEAMFMLAVFIRGGVLSDGKS